MKRKSADFVRCIRTFFQDISKKRPIKIFFEIQTHPALSPISTGFICPSRSQLNVF